MKKTTKHIAAISEMVCQYTGISWGAMQGKTRKREVVQTRQLIHSLCKEAVKGATLEDIGNLAGGKDHATVLHGIKTVSNLCETDRRFSAMYKSLRKEALELVGLREIQEMKRQQESNPTASVIRETLDALAPVPGTVQVKINLRGQLVHLETV